MDTRRVILAGIAGGLAWTPVPLAFPLWWMAELWLGAIAAGFVIALLDPRR